jgi:hypothetical protein
METLLRLKMRHSLQRILIIVINDSTEGSHAQFPDCQLNWLSRAFAAMAPSSAPLGNAIYPFTLPTYSYTKS